MKHKVLITLYKPVLLIGRQKDDFYTIFLRESGW